MHLNIQLVGFFSSFTFICVYVSVWVYVTYVWVPMESRRRHWISGIWGATGGCEPLDISAGSQTPVLYQSNKQSQPTAVSSVQGIQHPLLATMGTVLKLNLKRSCVSCSGTHSQVDGINLRVNARGHSQLPTMHPAINVRQEGSL